jgi:hypothetical protein
MSSNQPSWSLSELQAELVSLNRHTERGHYDPVIDKYAWVDKPGVVPAPTNWLREIQEFGGILPANKWRPIIQVEAFFVNEKPDKEIVFSLVTYSTSDPNRRLEHLVAKYGFVTSGKINDEAADLYELRENRLPECRMIAIDCINRWLEFLASIQKEPESIQQAALRAVVESGLAAVVSAAANAPSAEIVSAKMLPMLSEDSRRYQWTAERWVRELSLVGVRCSKKTIIGHKKNGSPPCKAWAEILAWRESNKRNRVSKETGEKNLRRKKP